MVVDAAVSIGVGEYEYAIMPVATAGITVFTGAKRREHTVGQCGLSGKQYRPDDPVYGRGSLVAPDNTIERGCGHTRQDADNRQTHYQLDKCQTGVVSMHGSQ